MSAPNKLLAAASGASGGPFLVTTLYTGNSTNFREFNVGHATSMVINRMRNPPVAQPWCLTDVVRGVGKPIRPDRQLKETDSPNTIREFTSTGFKTGTANLTNESPYNYVAYSFTTNNPLANTNTEGSITSTVNVGRANGFSICTYTGNGTTGATYGHELNSAPELVITKRRDVNTGWVVTGTVLGANQFMSLDLTNGVGTITNTPVPTSSVITLGNDTAVNGSGGTYVSFCFHSVTGKSKVGTYTGNGNADGTFVYTGFKPAFVLLKSINNGGWHWRLMDSVRDNNMNDGTNNILFPNHSSAELSNELDIDYLSNGFKIRDTRTGINGSGWTIMYMAFAKNPIVGSNDVPATAV